MVLYLRKLNDAESEIILLTGGVTGVEWARDSVRSLPFFLTGKRGNRPGGFLFTKAIGLLFMPIKSVARSKLSSRIKYFQVTGIAMVPVECALTVAASNEADAMKRAQKTFDEAGVCMPNRRNKFIVAGSVDENGVCDFKPGRAKRI